MEKHWLKSYPPGVRPEINVNEYPSLKEMIERGLAIHSVRDAYVQMGKAMTFGELDVLSAQFGAFLQTACGLKKGDRVAVMMPNVLQYPIVV
ncbi:MAG TPA: AMP-binding protein, partial [Steroidobacteraceae bacterium]